MEGIDLEQFSLDKQFHKYLLLLGLKVAELHPLQLKELKQAYIAGCTMMMDLFTTKLPMLDDEEALARVTDMQTDAQFFWEVESKQKAVQSGIKLVN